MRKDTGVFEQENGSYSNYTYYMCTEITANGVVRIGSSKNKQIEVAQTENSASSKQHDLAVFLQ